MLEQKTREYRNIKVQEYMMLRDEMYDQIRVQDKIINLCLTTTTAILAFAFSQKLSLIVLAVYPIIFFCLSKVIRHRNRVMCIIGYQIEHLEPIIGFGWETYCKNKAEPPRTSNEKESNKKSKTTFEHFANSPHYHLWGALGLMAMVTSILIDIIYGNTFSRDVIAGYYCLQAVLITLICCKSYTLAKAHEKREEECLACRHIIDVKPKAKLDSDAV